jgi:hypothetical protein
MISADSSQDSNTVNSTTATATSATMSCDLIVFKIEEIPTILSAESVHTDSVEIVIIV